MDRPHAASGRGGGAVGADPRIATPAGADSTDFGDRPAARLGVLGGTFNPPHRGHLALARHAGEELGLERVLLMPARISPGKPVDDDPGPQCRLEMCRLAVAGVEGVDTCARRSSGRARRTRWIL